MIKDWKFEWVVIYKGTAEIINDKFTKMTMVIEELQWDWQYKQSIAVDFSNKGIEFADKINVLDYVRVEVKFNSNEWKWKYYNSLRGWNIKKLDTPEEWLPF